MKCDINESIETINLIYHQTNKILEDFKKIIILQEKVKKETEIKNILRKKSNKINDFIEKGKKILINNCE